MQPEALRLANWLENKIPPNDTTTFANIAAELRRLHEVNIELLKALKNISLCSQNSMSSKTECGTIARATITKAEGDDK
jgi:hypothetical protein